MIHRHTNECESEGTIKLTSTLKVTNLTTNQSNTVSKLQVSCNKQRNEEKKRSGVMLMMDDRLAQLTDELMSLTVS